MRLTSDLLYDVLHLPEDVKVVGASWDFEHEVVVLYVSGGSSLPETPEGGVPPIVTLTWNPSFV